MKQIMIAGVSSGVGKTILTLGIMKALKNRGLSVQPYKVGPDYIDTGFHRRVCQQPSINLDEFLITDDDVLRSLYLRALQGKDISVIEGVMGLYDGFGVDKRYGSSAGMAYKLNVPVVLVIDGKATSTSAAAVVKGFLALDPAINIAGVIVNRVASESHYQLIKESIEKYNAIKVLGYLKKNVNLELPSRHLGLVPESELFDLDERLDRLAIEIEQTIDLDSLLDLSESMTMDEASIDDYVHHHLAPFEKSDRGQNLTLAYALDSAFSFYYPDNLSLFERNGIKLISFSPLFDSKLPKADAYYFGGGFPELFADQLSINKTMRQEICLAFEQDIPIFAECGGLMYLGEYYENQEGDEFSMVGVIPGKSYMTSRLKRFGYCSFTPQTNIVIGKKDWLIRGHEFHHSEFESSQAYAGYSVKEREGQVIQQWPSGFASQSMFASYLHVHFYQDPQLIDCFIKNMKEKKS
ncbi:cobyrinate a,c-diamide synthase [Facklamia sp. DSM 111018]|uniref:Cobyrinate a,c-diamide synthase n=1 Tax=Facklamia lactis TaxID=2749967 RepID=A0ABS0LNV8_9LACT|nr:cobyrinate a,c-diamide synthase [Facklamia lactis]MBG9985836.1 cobyrinate a,c-diamide synthase [Facklamia lactis]